MPWGDLLDLGDLIASIAGVITRERSVPGHDLLDLGDLPIHLRQAAVVLVGDQPAEALLVRGDDQVTYLG